mmetsp:Transcript_43726/g.138211  ORF Transcript_43726/g.138211 Transcript_43726/m.138211 type:complete len:117 (+) Transcript_43726:894-1244(+)
MKICCKSTSITSLSILGLREERGLPGNKEREVCPEKWVRRVRRDRREETATMAFRARMGLRVCLAPPVLKGVRVKQGKMVSMDLRALRATWVSKVILAPRAPPVCLDLLAPLARKE